MPLSVRMRPFTISSVVVVLVSLLHATRAVEKATAADSANRFIPGVRFMRILTGTKGAHSSRKRGALPGGFDRRGSGAQVHPRVVASHPVVLARLRVPAPAHGQQHH